MVALKMVFMSGRPSLPPLSLLFPVSKPLILTGIITWDILLSLFFSTWFQITSSISLLPYRPHFIAKTVIAIKVISYLFLNPQLFPMLFSVVWTSLISSTDNFKCYVIFVNYFTHYIWLYQLKRKSNVSLIFPCFKTLVENFFNGKCKHPFPVRPDWWVRIGFRGASRIHLSNIFHLDI